MVSLLLRHGADPQLCNNAQQRPIDVADDDEVIEFLSQQSLAQNKHLPAAAASDEFKPTPTDSHHWPTASQPCTDQRTGPTKRRYDPLSGDDDDDDRDVDAKKPNYQHHQACDLHEPLDLSIRKGAYSTTVSVLTAIFQVDLG